MDETPPNLPEEHLLKGQPRLKFRNANESLESVREREHRWWWEFLRLSKDYWMLCQTSRDYKAETQDRELARVYRAFGDIHNRSFDEWWLDRGNYVFREQERFPSVKELARHPRDRAGQRLLADHVWVDIPLKLSRRTIQRQLGKILDQYEHLRLDNRLALSTSKFKLNPVQFRLHTIKKMYEIYSLHRELIAKPNALHPKKKHQAGQEHRADLFRIGKLLRVSPSNEVLRGEAEEIHKRQNRMRASVSRLLNRTDLLIANVEQGVFPSFKPLAAPERARFNSRQLEMHKALEPQWWALNLTSSLSVGKIEDARKIHYEEELRTRQSSVTSKRERVVKYS